MISTVTIKLLSDGIWNCAATTYRLWRSTTRKSRIWSHIWRAWNITNRWQPERGPVSGVRPTGPSTSARSSPWRSSSPLWSSPRWDSSSLPWRCSYSRRCRLSVSGARVAASAIPSISTNRFPQISQPRGPIWPPVSTLWSTPTPGRWRAKAAWSGSPVRPVNSPVNWANIPLRSSSKLAHFYLFSLFPSPFFPSSFFLVCLIPSLIIFKLLIKQKKRENDRERGERWREKEKS